MQPGLSRAVPLGILGFLVGTGLLMLIRALQSLDPVLDSQLAIVMGSLFCATFFVWGMGAFDPKMSEHAHEPGAEDEHALAHAEEAPEVETPIKILGGYMWLSVTLLMAVILVVAFFGFLPQGPALKTVSDPMGDVAAISMFDVEIGDQIIQVSKLTVLIAFVAFMFVSLLVVAGAIGFITTSLSEGAKEARATSKTVLGPAPMEARSGFLWQLVFIAIFVVLTGVLYLLFYYILIGLILPTAPYLGLLSWVNALVFAILILRPKSVARLVSRVAAAVARFLRRIPGAIQ
jgi:hypothetical protein